jgi:hypothetical protein
MFTRPRRFGKSLNMSMLKPFLRLVARKNYLTDLQSDGMQTIVKYEIACFKKHCKVIRG